MDEFSFKEYWDKLNPDYQSVIESIAVQLNNRNFDNPQRNEPWGGLFYWDHIYHHGKGTEERQLFKIALDNSGVKFDTIKRISSQGSGEAATRTAFCASAFVHEKELNIPFHQFLLNFYALIQKRNSHLKLDEFIELFEDIKQIKPFAYLSDINLIVRSDSIGFEATSAVKLPVISEHSSNKRFDTPSSLLKWNAYLTALEGREDELAYLQNWLRWGDEKQVSTHCLLIHGEGGIGKTRLAAEFTKGLDKEDWTAGFFNINDVNNQCVWQCGKKGILLIVDYPEEQSSQLEKLLLQLNAMDTLGKQLRILLLSRNHDYAHKLALRAENLFYPPLSLLRLSKEQGGFSLLKHAFQAIINIKQEEQGTESAIDALPVTEQQFDDWLNGATSNEYSANQTPLMILALAYYLAANQDQPILNITSLGHHRLIRHLTEREVSRIKAEVVKHNEGLHSNNIDASPISIKGTLLTKALAAIPKGFDAQSLQFFIEDLSNSVVEVKPPSLSQIKSLSLWKDRALEALEPDILASDFLAYNLSEHAILQESPWVFAALGLQRTDILSMQELLNRFFSMGRLIYDYDVILQSSEKAKIFEWQWPLSAMTAYLSSNSSVCKHIAYFSSKKMPLNLVHFSIVALKKQLELDLIDSEKAKYLNNLSNCLANVGQNKEALEAIQQAESIRARLAMVDAAQYEPVWARSLHNLSHRLADAGQSIEALKAIQQAEAICARLAEVDPAQFVATWGRSLNSLSLRLSKVGQNREALKAIQQAETIHARLAKTAPSQHEQSWALSLQHLSYCLGNVGQNREALKAIQQAETIHARLAKVAPAVYEPEWACSLNILSNCLRNIGQNPESLKIIQKAEAIYKRLTKTSPARFEPKWARSLNDFSNCLRNMGQNPEALKVIQQAEAIFARLAEETPARYEPDWAASLIDLSICLTSAGQFEEALEVIRQAEIIFARLVKKTPALYEANWARSLSIRSLCLVILDQEMVALELIRQAESIYARLANTAPLQYGVDWVSSLNTLSQCLGFAGQYTEALKALQQAEAICARLAKSDPVGLVTQQITILHNKSLLLVYQERLLESIEIYEHIDSDYYSVRCTTEMINMQQGTLIMLEQLRDELSTQDSHGISNRCASLIEKIESRLKTYREHNISNSKTSTSELRRKL